MPRKSRATELIEGNTHDALLSLAKRKKLEVNSKMNKTDLANAIAKAEKKEKKEQPVKKEKNEY